MSHSAPPMLSMGAGRESLTSQHLANPSSIPYQYEPPKTSLENTDTEAGRVIETPESSKSSHEENSPVTLGLLASSNDGQNLQASPKVDEMQYSSFSQRNKDRNERERTSTHDLSQDEAIATSRLVTVVLSIHTIQTFEC